MNVGSYSLIKALSNPVYTRVVPRTEEGSEKMS